MDLFYAGKTPEESIKKIKKDLKFLNQNKFPEIMYGQIDYINRNILFIQEHINNKFMKDNTDKDLIKTINEYKLDKYFITYSHLLNTNPLRNDIKNFAPWIHKIIDVLNPKLIVILGENTCFTFFTKKFLLKNHHGNIIGYHNNIPVILTYSMDYYIKNDDYRDLSFKLANKKNDWEYIQKEYIKYVS